jgi:hypothetical protein
VVSNRRPIANVRLTSTSTGAGPALYDKRCCVPIAENEMALANAIWKPATVHHVVAEFLLNERQTNFADIPQALIPRGAAVIDAPNLNDPQENHMRLRVFYNRRAPFFVEIPPDTQWHEVSTLTDNELDELHVVAYPPLYVASNNCCGKIPLLVSLVSSTIRQLSPY